MLLLSNSGTSTLQLSPGVSVTALHDGSGFVGTAWHYNYDGYCRDDYSVDNLAHSMVFDGCGIGAL